MYTFAIPGVDSAAPATIQSMNRADARDRRTLPTFYVEAVEDKSASEKEGRPVFRDVEFVRIAIAGDSKTEVVHKVTDKIRNQFPQEYDHWKRTQQQAVVGTPLEQWPGASVSFVKTCKMMNVYTVEALADLTDAHLRNLGMDARTMQARAKAWLESARDNAATERLAAENSRLHDEVELLKQQIKDMGTRFQEMAQSDAPRKGR